jgi:hypothetical protein
MALIFEDGTLNSVARLARNDDNLRNDAADKARQLIDEFYENQLFEAHSFTQDGFQCTISRHPQGFYQANIVVPVGCQCDGLQETEFPQLFSNFIGSRDEANGLWTFSKMWEDCMTFQDMARVHAVLRLNNLDMYREMFLHIMQKPIAEFADVLLKVEQFVEHILTPRERDVSLATGGNE